MRQYPIWNDVKSCIYKSDKSFGARDTSETDIFVGSSNTNSKLLAKITTTRRREGDLDIFKLYIDGKVVKKLIFNTKTKEFTHEKI